MIPVGIGDEAMLFCEGVALWFPVAEIAHGAVYEDDGSSLALLDVLEVDAVCTHVSNWRRLVLLGDDDYGRYRGEDDREAESGVARHDLPPTSDECQVA